jgi:hypothetical protein
VRTIRPPQHLVPTAWPAVLGYEPYDEQSR